MVVLPTKTTARYLPIALAHLDTKRKITQTYVRWASLALIAGYFLTFGLQLPHIQNDTNTIYAALYAILAALSFGASTVFSKKLLHKLDFITATILDMAPPVCCYFLLFCSQDIYLIFYK